MGIKIAIAKFQNRIYSLISIFHIPSSHKQKKRKKIERKNLISIAYTNPEGLIAMSKETIVILDAEKNTQWPLKTFLENEEYNVIPVNTIEKALKKFSEFEVSGLITEYWVNHSSTLEAIRGFKKMFPEAYVMMLTNGELQENEYEEIMKAGTDDLFMKPFSIKRIFLHIQKGLKQRQSLIQKKRLVEKLNRISPGNNYPG